MRNRLLVRHFLQRFLDNDVISPDADRHETVAVAGAALISLGLFVTILMSLKYLGMPFQSPGRTAVRAIGDRLLYISWSMLVMALVAVVSWDGLSLDARDTAILGPLPIARRSIVCAKLTAVVLFGLGLDVAVNALPSIIHPMATVAQLPVSVFSALLLIVIHAFVTLSAGAFGFLSVLVLREVVRALLGASAFTRAAAIIRTVLVVSLVTVFLLLPGLARAVPIWLQTGTALSRSLPSLWFLGLHERLAGDLIDRLPRGDLPRRVLEIENQATSLYRNQRTALDELGTTAVRALLAAVVGAMSLFIWNNRRLPLPGPPRTSPLRLGGGVARLMRWTTFGHASVADAGFFFTLQSLFRSAPHRVALATSLGIGLAITTVSLRGLDAGRPADLATMPLALLVTQTLLVVLVLAGFRHAVRVPAELRANWMFQMSWPGHERAYFAGVKRGAVVALGLPVVLALSPFHVVAIGSRLALVHGAAGVLLVIGLLEILFLGLRKLPFACRYTPEPTSLKLVVPLFLLGLWVAYGLAMLERLALASVEGIAALLGVLTVLVASARVMDWRRRRDGRVMEFDPPPDPPTQRLSLSG